jgi:hypothetical protein
MLSELGLDRWGVRHGLATKLEMRSLDREQREGLVQGSAPYGADWFDLDRSLLLYEEVYEFRGLRERPVWQDRSAANIPLQYYVMALQLADVAELAELEQELVARLQRDAVAFQAVAQGGSGRVRS